MILILIGIIVAVVLTAVLFWFADASDGVAGFIAGVLGVGMGIATSITVIAYCFMGWSWIASEHKVAIINREYKTSYTREEIFYASDVINTIRELDRKRIEINGNLMKDKK